MRLVRFAVLGSPPRMRGKDDFVKLFSLNGGITPAYAGKSCSTYFCIPAGWDHPRVCGEKSGLGTRTFSNPGSPPRMRGKAHFAVCPERHAGITPAYAGKSSTDHSFRQPSRDHPRVCGEKMQKFWKRVRRWGSPPRMRGKGCGVKPDVFSFGITPAYAGKSVLDHSAAPAPRDHPRVCGEKLQSVLFFGVIAGSPPRMRGKGPAAHKSGRSARITPAYAGKSRRNFFRRVST